MRTTGNSLECRFGSGRGCSRKRSIRRRFFDTGSTSFSKGAAKPLFSDRELMIVEHRTYTMKPGTIPEYFRLYQSEGLPIQRRYLPAMIGYYTTELGPLNQVIHLWAYQS